MMRTIVAKFLIVTFCASAALSQENVAQPSPELKKLENWIGSFKGTARSYRVGSNGVPAVREFEDRQRGEWVCGGRFLQIRIGENDLMGLVGFDPQTGQYRFWHYIPQRDNPIEYTGRLEGTRLVFHTTPGRKSYLIGLGMEKVDDYVLVTRASPDGPAAQAGIRAGDRIVKINGASVKALSQVELLAQLRVSTETTVRLGVVRKDKEQEFLVRRTLLPEPDRRVTIDLGKRDTLTWTSESRRDGQEFSKQLEIVYQRQAAEGTPEK